MHKWFYIQNLYMIDTLLVQSCDISYTFCTYMMYTKLAHSSQLCIQNMYMTFTLWNIIVIFCNNFVCGKTRMYTFCKENVYFMTLCDGYMTKHSILCSRWWRFCSKENRHHNIQSVCILYIVLHILYKVNNWCTHFVHTFRIQSIYM